MSSLLNARAVKNTLLAKFSQEPWFVGIGATREDGIGFVVKVSVRPGVARPDDAVPASVDGVPVLIVESTDAP